MTSVSSELLDSRPRRCASALVLVREGRGESQVCACRERLGRAAR